MFLIKNVLNISITGKLVTNKKYENTFPLWLC